MTPHADSVPPADASAEERAPERPPGGHPRGGRDRVHRHRRAGRLVARGECTGGAGVLGHRPLRDGGARARGLSRAAPHERRSHPDRQGLPLLRRPPHGAGRARSQPAAPGGPVLRPGPRRDGDGARAGDRPALRAHLLRRGRGRALATKPPASGRSSWSASRRSHALLVVVLSDGAVEKRTIDLAVRAPPTRRWATPPRLLGAHLVGQTLSEPWTVPAERVQGGRPPGRGGQVGLRLHGGRGVGPGLRRRPRPPGRVLRRRRDGALGAQPSSSSSSSS